MNKIRLILLISIFLSSHTMVNLYSTINNVLTMLPAVISFKNKIDKQAFVKEELPNDLLSRVLRNEIPFKNGANDIVYLYDYFSCANIDDLAEKLLLAVVDMDGDMTYEIVLRDKAENSIVLHVVNESVLAYEFDYRGMSFLYRDGSFVWSNNDNDNGYAKLQFTENDYNLIELASIKPNIEHYSWRQVIPIIGEEVVSEEEFKKYISFQEVKRVKWHEFTERNINDTLSLYENSISLNEISNNEIKVNEAVEAIQRVLLQKTPFVSEMNGFVFLDDYYGNDYKFDSVYGNVSMIVEDVDSDEIPEVILSCFPGILNVFHYLNGQVYCYGFSNRQMNGLKKDGTFGWAGSAFNHGYGKVLFDNENICVVKTAEIYAKTSEVETVLDISYFIDGKSVTLYEYEAFSCSHNAKESVTYHNFTNENISNIKNIFYSIPLDSRDTKTTNSKLPLGSRRVVLER